MVTSGEWRKVVSRVHVRVPNLCVGVRHVAHHDRQRFTVHKRLHMGCQSTACDVVDDAQHIGKHL